MRYRIFLTGTGIAEQARALLDQNHCDVEVGSPADTVTDLVQKFRKFDPHGVIVRQGRITAEVQDAASSLKVICKHGVGTDNIDVISATRRGIPVFFTPGANFQSGAEHSLALMLSLLRHIPTEDRRIRHGVFDKINYSGQELTGKTVGLIGYGRIARRLAELLAPFECQIVVYHPSTTDEPLPVHVSKTRDLAEVFARAHIISIHCSLNAGTRDLINAKTIAQMRRGSLIVNTGRGEVINEEDLVIALREEHIGGAALDVFREEPLPTGHPLLGLENVILTPHVAGVSDNSYINMGVLSVRNVLAVLQQRQLDSGSLLNPEALQPTASPQG